MKASEIQNPEIEKDSLSFFEHVFKKPDRFNYSATGYLIQFFEFNYFCFFFFVIIPILVLINLFTGFRIIYPQNKYQLLFGF